MAITQVTGKVASPSPTKFILLLIYSVIVQVYAVGGLPWVRLRFSWAFFFSVFVFARDEDHVSVRNSLIVLPDPYCAGGALTALARWPESNVVTIQSRPISAI